MHVVAGVAWCCVGCCVLLAERVDGGLCLGGALCSLGATPGARHACRSRACTVSRMAGWRDIAVRTSRSSLWVALRYPLLLGLLWAFGFLGAVVVNQGRSVAGTLTVAFFVGCGVTLAAYFWRDRGRPLRAEAPECRCQRSPDGAPES